MNAEQMHSAETQDDESCSAPDSPRKPVKSTAVVKYSAVQSFANFALLQCNTDLNLPPSNWLSSSAESYGLQYVPSHSSGFSSFRMAHMFPDCVGEVDVVSDAENIKKLLKIPYSKGPVSMMVHRIENTLLIDEFDIHKHLLRTAETEWEWLKKFFFDHVLKSLSDKEKGLFHKNNSRCALQQKSLASKFLYHSLAVAEPKDQESEMPEDDIEAPVAIPVTTTWPPLPEPRPEENLPDPASNHKFARNVVWTFEDIQMLIGTDMPIFGGSTHPCVSLRLRDMSKPINVLTGIDYWLDNLMCNVPELVMCYHLDGIVQKYELIKTEDLPHQENSKFSPKVIRDVAQNILSFLKSNATKAGHTYWLFKGKDDDVVKLYDLTSLCTDVMDEKGQNPFTVPVAMLLYRVARNMKHSTDAHRQQGTIRMLLKNCIALLAKEKYPQIVTSAHYMLSDLYVPADTDPASPGLDGQLNDEEECASGGQNGMEDAKTGAGDTSCEGSLSSSTSVPVKALCVSSQGAASDDTKYSSPPPLCGGVEERCRMALQHVASGLQCLQYFDHSDQQKQMKGDKQSQEQETPKMARPFEAIPMPYTPLSGEAKSVTASKKKKKKDKLASVPDMEDSAEISPKALLCSTMPTRQQPDKADSASWNVHLKTLLYEKACLVYVTLAESDYVAENYGRSLHYIAHVLHVLSAVTSNAGLRSYLLGRAGDCCFMIVQNWARVEAHREGYTHSITVDCEIMEEVDKDVASVEDTRNDQLDLLPECIESMEQMMQASCGCYETALALEPHDQQKNNLRRRLGNIHNELGVLYMHQAAGRSQDEKEQQHLMFTQSLRHLEAGVKAFDIVHDGANLALLHSNTGRLMRLCAHFHSNNRCAKQERQFYNKAIASYNKALDIIGSRKKNPGVWDTVMWEMSTTVFSMATILQDYPTIGNKSQDEVEREVVDCLKRALSYCDQDTPGIHQPVYQFRAATIYHRLASLYHKCYRNSLTDDLHRKSMLHLASTNYDKASRLLLQLERPSEFLRVQLEHVALFECQAENTSNYGKKLDNFDKALKLLLECQPMLKIMVERSQTVEVSGDFKSVGAKCLDVTKVPQTRNKREKLTETLYEGQDVATDSASDACKGMEGTAQTCNAVPEEVTIASGNKSVDRVSAVEECVTFKDHPAEDSASQNEEDLAELEEELRLVQLLEARLQFVLLSLTKLYRSKGSSSKKGSADLYKKLYSLALQGGSKEPMCRLLDVLTSVDSVLATR